MGNGINYPKLRTNADFANFILDVLYSNEKEATDSFNIAELRDILYTENMLQKYLKGFKYAGVLDSTRTTSLVSYNFTDESVGYMLKHRDMYRIKVTKSADKWLRNKYMDKIKFIHEKFGFEPFNAVDLSSVSGNKITSCVTINGKLHSASFITPIDDVRKTHPEKMYKLSQIAQQVLAEA